MKAILRNFFGPVKQALPEGQSGWSNAVRGWSMPFGGHRSAAGKIVSSESAMRLSAVFAATSRTSLLMSTLPIDLYETDGQGNKHKINDTEIADILRFSPNSEQTGPEFWEGQIANQLLRGNSVSEKLFIGKRLVGLRPLLGCDPFRNRNGELQYEFVDRGKREVLPSDKVFHMRGFGAGDGLGMSVVKYGAESMGAALAADETAGSVFANAMMMAGIVSSEQTLDDEQRSQLQTMLEGFVGSKKAGKTMALEAGLKYSQVQMNPEDAQLLETRRFQVEDVCRWFGIPPIVIGHAAEGQTMWGTGVESIMLAWLTTGINPLLRRLEARILKDLIPAEKRRRWIVEFNREAMLQMDSKSKAVFLSSMGASGTMSANERRDKLNLPRHDDPNANALLAQTALAPLETLGKDGK
jgi:HK97 family phage portal protein